MLDNISHIIQKEIGIIPEKIQLLLRESINKIYHCRHLLVHSHQCIQITPQN